MSYQQLITDATGVTDKVMLDRIEDTMRNAVFHSTLDWQTASQLRAGAKLAHDVLKEVDNLEEQHNGTA